MQSLVTKATLFSVVALSAVFTSQARAGTSTTVTPLGTVLGSTSFSTPTTVGSFVDLYNFQVGPNGAAVFDVLSIAFSGMGATVQSLALYKGALAIGDIAAATALATNDTPIVFTANGDTTTILPEHAGALTPMTDYTLAVTGVSTSALPYFGVLVLSAVPEPETYALMLAGLGMIGVVAQRRRRTS